MHKSDLLPTRYLQWLEHEVISFEEPRECGSFRLHGRRGDEAFAVLRVGLVLTVWHTLVSFVLLFDCAEVGASTGPVVFSCWWHSLIAARAAWHLQMVLVYSVEAVGERALDDGLAGSSQARDQ